MYMVVSLGNIFELVNPLKGSWEPSDPTLRTTSTHPDDASFTPIHPLDRSLGVCGQGGLSPEARPPVRLPSHTLISDCLDAPLDCASGGQDCSLLGGVVLAPMSCM